MAGCHVKELWSFKKRRSAVVVVAFSLISIGISIRTLTIGLVAKTWLSLRTSQRMRHTLGVAVPFVTPRAGRRPTRCAQDRAQRAQRSSHIRNLGHARIAPWFFSAMVAQFVYHVVVACRISRPGAQMANCWVRLSTFAIAASLCPNTISSTSKVPASIAFVRKLVFVELV